MKGIRLISVIAAVSFLLFSGCIKVQKQTLLIGGFTTGNEKGMALFAFDKESGSLTKESELEVGPSPTLFCFSTKRDLVYIVNEVSDFKGETAGGVTTLRIGENHSVTTAGEIPVPYGGPCFISISGDQKFLFVASYSSGSVAVLKLNAEGIPRSVTDTIKYASTDSLPSHPHMIAQDPLSRHIYLTDLGLDRLVIYDLDTVYGKIRKEPFQEIKIPQGSGPRHFIFNKAADRMYLINELGSTIMTFNVSADGKLDLVQTVRTTDESYSGKNQCAEITLSEDGKFLYGSNRGENSIVVFKVAPDGTLTFAGRSTCGGDWPRFFMIDPSGRFILSGNQKSDYVSVFKINEKTGIPEALHTNTSFKAPAYIGFLK